MRRRQRTPAFTLVELLVALGIIALLTAILLPSLHLARESAKRVQCLGNLRQMVIAADAYVADNRGSYPIAYWYELSGDTSTSYAWDLTTVSVNGVPAQVVPGLLWGTKGNIAIQQCPSFEGAANWLGDPYTGYNYNASYIGHGQYESVPAPAKAGAIKRSSEVAIFGDGQWASGANKFMRAPFPNPGDEGFGGRWAGTQGFRHRKATNAAFADGHAESLRDRFTANADGAANVVLGTGFLSRDNRAYGGN